MGQIEHREMQGEKRITLSPDFAIGINASQTVNQVIIGNHAITIPSGRPFEAFSTNLESEGVTVEDFSTHPMNLFNRWQEKSERDEEIRRSLINAHQDRIIVTVSTQEGTIAFVLPKILREHEAVSVVELKREIESPFSVQMFEMISGKLQLIDPKISPNGAKILHGTQIIGHVKDGCDMQVHAHRKGTLQELWNFAFPPTARTATNQEEAAEKGVPTFDVSRNWSYAGPTDDFRSDFHDLESFKSVVGFFAANAILCVDVAKGKYAIVSTNFRSEGQLLKLVNPNLLLGGINFTFLNGQPGKRMTHHTDIPKFMKMLGRVQVSLEKAPDRIEELGLPRAWTDDWWEICRQKMQGLDFLLFRTFSRDKNLPQVIDGTQIIQIPQPIPEIRFSRNQAREYVSTLICRKLTEYDNVILLPGTSEDGGTQKRLREVITMARENPQLIVITPMRHNDPRLREINLPDNVFPIGFREDWMDIIPAGDITFLRGSWGEILDCIAAGNIPIISSPGIVPDDKPLEETQFLTEVSGERATNLSLLIKELQRNGAQTSTIEGLLADINNDHNEITHALRHALCPEVREEIRTALSMIPRGGIGWMVDIHEMLLDKKTSFTQDEITRLEGKIWSNENDRRRIA